MPAVICNTSPLQYLYQSDGLELLAELFGQVQVPEAVAVELIDGRGDMLSPLAANIEPIKAMAPSRETNHQPIKSLIFFLVRIVDLV